MTELFMLLQISICEYGGYVYTGEPANGDQTIQ